MGLTKWKPLDNMEQIVSTFIKSEYFNYTAYQMPVVVNVRTLQDHMSWADHVTKHIHTKDTMQMYSSESYMTTYMCNVYKYAK